MFRFGNYLNEKLPMWVAPPERDGKITQRISGRVYTMFDHGSEIIDLFIDPTFVLEVGVLWCEIHWVWV